MTLLSISQTYSVGNQTFNSQAEAEAYIAQQQRLEAIGKQLKSLEPNRDNTNGLTASFAPVEWSPAKAASRFEQAPRTLLLIAAIALQGRDAAGLGIPADLAEALAELLATEQELG
jgi:hypothetical protein